MSCHRLVAHLGSLYIFSIEEQIYIIREWWIFQFGTMILSIEAGLSVDKMTLGCYITLSHRFSGYSVLQIGNSVVLRALYRYCRWSRIGVTVVWVLCYEVMIDVVCVNRSTGLPLILVLMIDC